MRAKRIQEEILGIQQKKNTFSTANNFRFHLILDKHEDSFKFLAQANSTSEWLWKIYYKCFMCGFVDGFATPIASVFICFLLNGYFDATQAFHPLRFMLA